MSLKKQTAKNISFNYLGRLVNAAISLIATPIIISHIGMSYYGLWSIVFSLTGYYGLLDLGIRNALTKFIAEYREKDDPAEINRLINTSLPLFALIAPLIFAISIGIAFSFENIFKTENIPLSDAQTLVILIGANIGINFLFQPIATIITGYNRFDIDNGISIVSSTVRSILLIVTVSFGYGVIAMGLVVLLIDSLTIVAMLYFAHRLFPELTIRRRYINRQTFHRIFGFSLLAFIRNIARLILERTDVVLIGIFLGTSQSAVYSISESLIRYMRLATQSVTSVLLPLSVSLKEKGRDAAIGRMMLAFPKYLLAVSTFILIAGGFFADTFIHLWVGSDFIDSYLVLCILMVARIFINSTESMSITAIGTGRDHFITVVSIVEMLANLGLSIFLVQKMGIFGVALGTAIPLSISRGIVIPLYGCRIVGASAKDYATEVLWPTLFASAPTVLTAYLIDRAFAPISYLDILIAMLLPAIIFSLFFARFLDPEITTAFKKMLRRSART